MNGTAEDTAKNVRARILDAAIELLKKSGAKKLSQPQVAREAGVPQGHLTYYFPRKIDLLLAVAERFVMILQGDLEQQRQLLGDRAASVAAARDMVVDRERTRMLIGLVTEADSEEALSEPVSRGARMMRTMVARAIERHPDDPDTWLTLALFWGLGVQQLLFPERSAAQVQALVERFDQWLESSKQIEEGALRQSGTVLKRQAG